MAEKPVKAIFIKCDKKPLVVDFKSFDLVKKSIVSCSLDSYNWRGDDLCLITQVAGDIVDLAEKVGQVPKPNRALFATQYMVDKKISLFEKPDTFAVIGDLVKILYGAFLVAKYDNNKKEYVDMSEDEITSVCQEFENITTGKDARDFLKFGIYLRQADV